MNTCNNDKILCFEYVLYKILKTHEVLCSQKEFSTLLYSYTRLKALKLLFLVTAVKADVHNISLLKVFNNFYAMQHGPVESDIYRAMVDNSTHFFDFSKRETNLKVETISEDSFNTLKTEFKNLVKDSIDELLVKNGSLLEEGPFRLVEITHRWSSWRNAFEIACILGKRSEKMNVEDIKKDIKYFS